MEPDRIVFTGDLTEELRRVQINKYIFYGDNNNYDIQSTKKCAQISRMKLMWLYDNRAKQFTKFKLYNWW